jgi:hypothetical protein
MLGDFDQPLRKIEGLAPLHPDRHRRAQARAAMAAGAGFGLDDPIGLGDLAQGLAFVALLPAARPARPFAKAHWRARLPQNRRSTAVSNSSNCPVRACASVRRSQPARLPTPAEARRSAPQYPAGESFPKGITNFQASLPNRRPQPHFPAHRDLSDSPGWAVTGKKISRAPGPKGRGAGGDESGLGMRKSRIGHRTSLSNFLIVRNQLQTQRLEHDVFPSNRIVIASHRASEDARPSGRGYGEQSRGTQTALRLPGSPRRFAPRGDESTQKQDACLMTFRAEKARRNRWERVAALSSAARVGSGVR